MVMKDKLVKTNHKGSYYLMKKIFIGLIAVVSGAFVIAVPTYIIHNSKKNTMGLAEEKTSEVSEQESNSEGVEYEEYTD